MKNKLISTSNKSVVFWLNPTTAVYPGIPGFTGNASTLMKSADIVSEITPPGIQKYMMSTPMSFTDKEHNDLSPFSTPTYFGIKKEMIAPELIRGVTEADLALNKPLEGAAIKVYAQQNVVQTIMSNVFQRSINEDSHFLDTVEANANKLLQQQIRELCLYEVLAKYKGQWTTWSPEDKSAFMDFNGKAAQDFLLEHRKEYLLEAYIQLEANYQLQFIAIPHLHNLGIKSVISTAIAPILNGPAGLFNSQAVDSPLSSARSMACTTEGMWGPQDWQFLTAAQKEAFIKYFIDQLVYLRSLGHDVIRIDHASGLLGGFNSVPRDIPIDKYLAIRDDLKTALTTSSYNENNWIKGNVSNPILKDAIRALPYRKDKNVKDLLVEMEQINAILEKNPKAVIDTKKFENVGEIFAEWQFLPGDEEARLAYGKSIADLIIEDPRLKGIEFIFETGGDMFRRPVANQVVEYLKQNGVSASVSIEKTFHPVGREQQADSVYGPGWDEPSFYRLFSGFDTFQGKKIVDPDWSSTDAIALAAASGIAVTDNHFPMKPEALTPVFFKTMFSGYVRNTDAIPLFPFRALANLNLTHDYENTRHYNENRPSTPGSADSDYRNWATTINLLDDAARKAWPDILKPENFLSIKPEDQTIYYTHDFMPDQLTILHGRIFDFLTIKTDKNQSLYSDDSVVGSFVPVNLDLSQYKIYDGKPLNLEGAKPIWQVVVGNKTDKSVVARIPTYHMLSSADIDTNKKYVLVDTKSAMIYPVNSNQLKYGGIFVELAPKGKPTDTHPDNHHFVIYEIK